DLVLQCYKKAGLEATVRFLDNLKSLGFSEATKAALSMGVCDVPIPPNKKKMIKEAHDRVDLVKKQYEDGIITDGERQSKTISIWTDVSDQLSEELFKQIGTIQGSQLHPL